jgi:hypothetical protein
VRIALVKLGGREIEECEGLGQDNQMLLAPGASERQGNFICSLLAALVALSGQGAWVALTRANGPDDALPRSTGAITEHLRQLDVPLQQGFLPVEDVGGTMRNELGPMTSEGPQGHKVRVGTTGRLQQSVAV